MAQKQFLFIGGTGRISSACVRRALALGHRVTVLNRGETALRAIPDEVEQLHADIRRPETVSAAVGGRTFDSVVDFVAYVPEHVENDIELFTGKTGQYVFISSASAYQTPPSRLPVTESTPLRNPYWQYSRDKIACEDRLWRAYREEAFPMTIVRPSHTYDRTSMVTIGRWTDIVRMRAGRPVVVHGDGTSQWTITHQRDFAVAFVGLLGRQDAVGDHFHITGDHAPTWNQIYQWLARAAGAPEPKLLHVPSDVIAAVRPDLGPGLLGDKTHSMVFDNSKVKALVPEFQTTITFDDGAREIMAWHDTHPEAQRVDPEVDATWDRLASMMAVTAGVAG